MQYKVKDNNRKDQAGRGSNLWHSARHSPDNGALANWALSSLNILLDMLLAVVV